MANLKEIRTRIASVASTRQITSAMKMVAAARLKKAQDAVTNFRPYALKMQEIMVNVASSVGRDDDNVYAKDRDYTQVLIVVITSNRGLCGAFNSNAIKEAVQLAERKYGKYLTSDKIRYMAIGKKGYDVLRKRKVPLDEPNMEIIEQLTYENASEFAQSLMNAFVDGRYDCIDIVYNEFINAASQKVMSKQFLPLLPEENGKEKNARKKATRTDYLFEPTKEYILRELIPQNLRLILYEALLDSVASEFGARMTSMHQATDNATTLIQDLTLQYNKARQAAITNELVEIVGGAEALKG
ncbi:MAG: ATP synthase F1 subunit gamma [Bacteroidales bacterium]|jgi:F-type H+-transporting ATPase subunit gamma|nr:ATP synthase F1 subunit gamma [Bacteroidales bacterium]